MIDAGEPNWRKLSQTFKLRFFNEETLESVLKTLNDLRIENFHKTEDPDDSNALKRLVTEMDRLCGMVLNQDLSLIHI